MHRRNYIKNSLFERTKVSLFQTTWEVVIWMCAEGQNLVTSTISVFLFNSFSPWNFPPWAVSFLRFTLCILFFLYLHFISLKYLGRNLEGQREWAQGPSEPMFLLNPSSTSEWSLCLWKVQWPSPLGPSHLQVAKWQTLKIWKSHTHRIYYPGKLGFQIWQQWKRATLKKKKKLGTMWMISKTSGLGLFFQ